jgi:hypothetical protein
MQGLNRQRHISRARIFEQFGDALFDLGVGGGEILTGRTVFSYLRTYQPLRPTQKGKRDQKEDDAKQTSEMPRVILISVSGRKTV